MAADPKPVELPDGPVDVEEVHRILPVVRQSTLATFDNCNLSAYWDLLSGWGFGGPEAAAGTIFHRTAAECLKTMIQTGNEQIPVAEAFEILYEVAAQKDVEPWDRVIVPMRLWPRLRLCVQKFAKDNTFSVDRIVAIEERLEAGVPYEMPDGRRIERQFSGQIDLLMFDPPDGAIVLDWKTGYGLPPAPRYTDEGELHQFFDSEQEAARNLSWEGYFQQRAYGWLVLKTYPSVNRVTLREFYVQRGQVRQATMYRQDLEHVERELGILLQDLDRAIAAGPEHAGTGSPRDPWRVQPGKGCRWCARANACPIEADARAYRAISSPEEASIAAAEFHVADAVRSRRRDGLKDWCEVNGPVPVRSAKGRAMIGFTIDASGKQVFKVFTPQTSDKGMLPPDLPHTDPRLEEAFAEAAAGIEEARAARRKRRVG